MQTPNSHPNTRHSVHLDGRLSVYSAFGDLTRDVQTKDPIEDGLKLVITNVDIDLRASHLDRMTFTQPTAFAILSEGEHERDQTFHAAPRRWDVALTLDRQLVHQEFGRSPEDLLGQTERNPVVCSAVPADPAMTAMVTQLLTMPDGNAGGMMRMGTGLNLAGLVLGQITTLLEAEPSSLKAVDRERIVHAQDLMRRDLARAPNVRDLARQTGANTAKFTRDFCSVTGMAPNAWLQEQRLVAAWHMLSSHSRSVSEVAHAVGYTPAHLSTLFRRRFDTNPRNLSHGGTRSGAI